MKFHYKLLKFVIFEKNTKIVGNLSVSGTTNLDGAVTLGNATSDDLVSLIRLARKKVLKIFGIHLDLEIKTIGFPEGTFEA